MSVKTCNAKINSVDKCSFLIINNTNYCKKHSYMLNYTNEQLTNLEQCGLCNLYKNPINNYRCSTCDLKPRCTFMKQYRQCDSIPKVNGLCITHYKKSLDDKLLLDNPGKKLCRSRRCKELIDNNITHCQSCLNKDKKTPSLTRQQKIDNKICLGCNAKLIAENTNNRGKSVNYCNECAATRLIVEKSRIRTPRKN